MVSTPDFGAKGPGLESHWRWISAYDCPLSQCHLNNVEGDLKNQIIIIRNHKA